LLIFTVEQNLIGVDAVVSVVMFSPFRNRHDARWGRTYCVKNDVMPKVKYRNAAREKSIKTTGNMHKNMADD